MGRPNHDLPNEDPPPVLPAPPPTIDPITYRGILPDAYNATSPTPPLVVNRSRANKPDTPGQPPQSNRPPRPPIPAE